MSAHILNGCVLQVQNRFVEDAAKTHGMGLEAQTFVREEAFSWVLQRHAQNPVNGDCMHSCGIGKPLQALLSALYEISSAILSRNKALPSIDNPGQDILALRVLILHSFVETCWRMWQEMIARACLEDGGISFRVLSLSDQGDRASDDVMWSHATHSTAQPTSLPVMPGRQSEDIGHPVALRQYISPLAKRVRPKSSTPQYGRVLSGGMQRPLSGRTGNVRPFSARISASTPDHVRLLPPNDTNAATYQVLERVRNEMSCSAFTNVAEAFVWFDLNRRQFLNVSEIDIGLKNLGILDVDVASLFSLCSDVQLKHGTDEPEISELQFIHLFQWDNQVSSNSKGLLIYGKAYRTVSEHAKHNERKIIEKVKAHRKDMICGKEELTKKNAVNGSSSERASGASSLQVCSFCKRPHDNDFVPADPMFHLPIEQQNILSYDLQSGVKYGSPLRFKKTNKGQRTWNQTSDSVNLQRGRGQQQAMEWDYNSLEQHLTEGYRDFSPCAILNVMATAVIDLDLVRYIMLSKGQQATVSHYERNQSIPAPPAIHPSPPAGPHPLREVQRADLRTHRIRQIPALRSMPGGERIVSKGDYSAPMRRQAMRPPIAGRIVH